MTQALIQNEKDLPFNFGDRIYIICISKKLFYGPKYYQCYVNYIKTKKGEKEKKIDST